MQSRDIAYDAVSFIKKKSLPIIGPSVFGAQLYIFEFVIVTWSI